MKRTVGRLKVLLLLFYFKFLLSLTERDFCLTGSNQIGQCVHSYECPLFLNKSSQIEICGFDSYQYSLLFCCPLSDQRLNGGRSRKSCEDYYTTFYHKVEHVEVKDVHDFPPEIASTDPVLARSRPREFPHMAALGFGDEPNIDWLCGGTLISNNFVLTAAHCTKDSHQRLVKWIRLGDLDLKSLTDDATPLNINVIQIFVYPKYKRSSSYHDIALLKINREVNFSPYYKPACLDFGEVSHVDKVEAIGWGQTKDFGEMSSHLLKVNLTVISYKKCRLKLKFTKKLKQGILRKYQLCAGDAKGGNTCQGDSGGPLHIKSNFGNLSEYQLGYLDTHFVVVGITSSGKGCSGLNSIGVYTKVASYLKWIEDIVWPLNSEKVIWLS